MELVMTEWVRRRNFLTTATPTVYDLLLVVICYWECPEEIATNAFSDSV